VSSTSPYTGVNAMAPKPIALTDNSSPSLTAGTEFAPVMIVPFSLRRQTSMRQDFQPPLMRIYSAEVPAN
jgi:hypothetical protein